MTSLVECALQRRLESLPGHQQTVGGGTSRSPAPTAGAQAGAVHEGEAAQVEVDGQRASDEGLQHLFQHWRGSPGGERSAHLRVGQAGGRRARWRPRRPDGVRRRARRTAHRLSRLHRRRPTPAHRQRRMRHLSSCCPALPCVYRTHSSHTGTVGSCRPSSRGPSRRMSNSGSPRSSAPALLTSRPWQAPSRRVDRPCRRADLSRFRHGTGGRRHLQIQMAAIAIGPAGFNGAAGLRAEFGHPDPGPVGQVWMPGPAAVEDDDRPAARVSLHPNLGARVGRHRPPQNCPIRAGSQPADGGPAGRWPPPGTGAHRSVVSAGQTASGSAGGRAVGSV
jgi:hypothetical protein